MLKELKTLFALEAKQELLQTTRDFHSCKQEEGQSASSYVLKMKGYIDNLERLGHPVTLGLGVSLILIGLRKEYDGFVQNYNMHNMGKTVNELYDMLNLHEQTLTKSNAPALNAIRAGKVQKGNMHKKSQSQTAARGQNHGKGKNKQAYAPKPKIPPPPKRENLTKDSICHECGEIGHWKRNCPYRLEIVLNNCHYAPSITRGVISVSRLYEDGFVNRFVDNTIQVSKNNVVYFSAIPRDGIFEIDLSNSLTNESSIYAVSNKRAKLDLDSALLWHCRLGHISKKRIEKLQHDGLLDSSDLRAFEKYVSCMSGKMARKPYTHQVERAKDLLGLIHTDMAYLRSCQDKEQATSSPSLMTSEIETQLGKTIKSLCSDHGGEYMSQEFLDHLKDHRIITHRTPPYTPHHNGMSKRRNRTLLDMVEKTPYEVWHGKAPKLSYLKVWGCKALVKRDTLTKSDKLEPRSIKCIFVGYPKETMGYSFYYPPRTKSTRTRHAPDHMCLYIDAKEHELGDLGEPTNYKAALLDLESEKWLNAMNVEFKWLFKKKTDMDGNVHIYKAHLMAKGYTQTPRIDYEETFSLVADIRAIRILIAIAAYYDYEIWQMDVKTAFLNGYLNEEEKLKLSKSQGASTPAELKRMQNVPYASVVGFIVYAVRCTRPDVAFAQNVTSRFQQNPGDIHWTTVKNILKYLRNTKDMFLVYGGDVDWNSAKQSIFATSSTEAEYIAAFDASKEAVWVRKFISGMGVVPTIVEPISMYCDNTRAIAITNESRITKGARHFRAKVHYLREVIEFGDIKLEKVHTDDNLADPFTKALAFPKHSEHTRNILMLPARSLM
uniref:CCHC-type domain-containing protein n=1 Tax=Tanacetum cinerariifolium TaxID=118510 RepID=A0A699GWG7_TANCI|nr:hypothetical protein [Tanacetum cinerariifolium]